MMGEKRDAIRFLTLLESVGGVSCASGAVMAVGGGVVLLVDTVPDTSVSGSSSSRIIDLSISYLSSMRACAHPLSAIIVANDDEFPS